MYVSFSSPVYCAPCREIMLWHYTLCGFGKKVLSIHIEHGKTQVNTNVAIHLECYFDLWLHVYCNNEYVFNLYV